MVASDQHHYYDSIDCQEDRPATQRPRCACVDGGEATVRSDIEGGEDEGAQSGVGKQYLPASLRVKVLMSADIFGQVTWPTMARSPAASTDASTSSD